MARIVSWGVALPSLRLPAKAYAAAWGSCAARGLVSKMVCAFDEDAVTLGAAAARRCLDRVAETRRGFDALFVGATTLPYEEKPSSASILSMLTGNAAVRVVEIRGSPQAGLQALAAAHEFCAANPGAHALAIAADVPRAHPAASIEHGLGAGAAAFLVSADATEGALIERVVSVSHETFGSRLRRRGAEWREDLELRVNDDAISLQKLGAHFPTSGVWLATGLEPSLQRTARRLFGAAGADEQWASVGDLGTASAAVALADALDQAGSDDGLFAVAVGAGATGIRLARARSGLLPPVPPLAALAAAATEIDYMRYLKESAFLARPGSGK